MNRRWIWSSLAAAAVLSLATWARAQCLTPDNLDGGACCTATVPNLPAFPAFTQGSMEICWRDCAVDSTISYDATWSAPAPVASICTVYLSNLQLKVGATNHWTSAGPMRLWYSRTWFESDGALQRLQVWRFLVNGDIRPTASAGPVPCPVPNCAAAFGNRVFVTGYVDWALDCTTGVWRNAWMLNHDCDRINHAIGFPRSGIFHKERTYTFVGPAASFVISAIGPVEAGPMALEAIRRLDLPAGGATGVCYFEERLIQGQVTHIADLCACRPIGPTPQYSQGQLDISGACGSQVSTTGGPFPKSLISKSIGRWTDVSTYPGLEGLRWNVAGYAYGDACTLMSRKELFYGVTTIGGYSANAFTSGGFGPPLDKTFIDQGNSVQNAAGTLVMNVPHLTNHIINVNLP